MRYIMQFETLHPGTTTIMMSTNYRCSGEIIGAANRLVEKNLNRIKKTMIPHRKAMERVQYFHGVEPDNAAQFVASEIARLHNAGIAYKNIAVLYRAHFVSGPYEQQMIRSSIPYLVCSGTPFYQRKEIKDALAYLGLVNSDNSMDFEKAICAPNRGIGTDDVDAIIATSELDRISLIDALDRKYGRTKPAVGKFVEMIRKYRKMADSMSVSELFGEIFVESGLDAEYRSKPDDERIDNIMTLKNSILDMEKSNHRKLKLQEYLDEVGTFTGADNQNTKDSVSLMTVHGAKGLEYPYVFVVGMNEGIFPTYRVKDANAMEEERRLAYVAFTRAKDKLYIVEAENSGYNGQLAYPSRFIFETQLNTLNTLKPLNSDFIQKALTFITGAESRMEPVKLDVESSTSASGSAWKAGAEVSHSIFGVGKIVSVQGDMITANFSVGTRTVRKEKLTLK